MANVSRKIVEAKYTITDLSQHEYDLITRGLEYSVRANYSPGYGSGNADKELNALIIQFRDIKTQP